MENASKALIIAGAILLAILIISLGIMIYNQAAGVVKNNSMDEVEIATFNQKIMQYEGNNVKGAQVNTLLSQVVQLNISMQDDQSRRIKLTVSATDWQDPKPNDAQVTSSTETGKAKTGKTYKVTTETDDKTGLVNLVKIENGN